MNRKPGSARVYRTLAIATALGATTLLASPWIRASKATRQRRVIIQNQQAANAERSARSERLRALQLDSTKLLEFVERHRDTSRDALISGGFLLPHAPAKGTRSIEFGQRTPSGDALLEQAKDTLFALLFGDAASHTRFDRVQRELLTLTLPRSKAAAFSFMQAATELSAAGTWHDPEGVSNDERADNMIVEVEYGEVHEEWIGDGIVTALRLINNLEINEQILYARMTDVEQSTLVN